ncbi:CynX/NimT family MFS transporter [Pseudonocardia spinosispora]|uniref:MFS transporter n=1 Tax=Pseudonocardia spinosispora TaxID=103441 RepID=UPI0004235217|nr:MFS transporter [Pseudonocardia spinosispora]
MSRRPWVIALGLLVVALNLRAALAGYPPLLPMVRAELGLSSGLAGAIQAGAVLAMAAGSFGGAVVVARLGAERTLGASVAVLAAGCLLRGVPTGVTLALGTAVVGLGIGTAGVCLAGVVRARFAARAGALTGGYVTAMMVGATVASAIAVPLSGVFGGWSPTVAVWTVPALLALALWLPLTRRIPPVTTTARSAARWSRFARRGACYMAGTSLLVYGWMTWLPPYYQSLGASPRLAGVLLAVWSIAQVPAALLVPALAERRKRWRFWASLSLASVAVGTAGALVLPMPPLVGPWLWVALIGFGSGAGFPLGLAVIAWRSRDSASGAATSGLAMGVGYLAAGFGPLVMGLLVDVTGGYPAAIAVLLLAALAQALAIVGIGDHDPDLDEVVTVAKTSGGGITTR